MKVGFVLSALVAVALIPGMASAQLSCATLSPTDAGAGDEITITGYDEAGEPFDLSTLEVWESNFHPEEGDWTGMLAVPGDDVFDNLEIVDGTIVFTMTALWMDAAMWDAFFIPGGDDLAFRFSGDDSDFATVAEVIAAGGVCPEGVGGPAGPNLSLNVEGATFAEEGGDITLSANDDMLAPYQWQLDGGDMGGETNATLSLSPTATGDSGVYTLEFDDGVAKATLISNPVSVSVFPAGSLPVSSLLGLGLLAMTSALAGGTVLARMKK